MGVSRSGDTTRADCENTPVVQRVIAVTVSDAMLTDKAGVRILLVRCSVFDTSGVEGEV